MGLLCRFNVHRYKEYFWNKWFYKCIKCDHYCPKGQENYWSSII